MMRIQKLQLLLILIGGCNILYLLVFLRQNLFGQVRFPSDIVGQREYLGLSKHWFSINTTSQPKNISLGQARFTKKVTSQPKNINLGQARFTSKVTDQLMGEKIDEIKLYLNDSSLSDKNNLPGNIVNGDYIIASPHICKDSAVVDLIIVVHSAPGHFNRRSNIRQSFANGSLFLPFSIKVGFMLGITKDKLLEKNILLENDKNNDLVIGNFIDDYRNLSIKGVLGFKWVSQHCSNARLVLEIDDDVMVNTYKILGTLLDDFSMKNKTIFGNVWPKDEMEILRDGKWKIEPHVFFGREFFPIQYTSGFFVMFSTDLMYPLYQASKVAPFFWVSDIYLSGMLPYIVGNVDYYNLILDESITLDYGKALRCLSRLGVRCPLIATDIPDEKFWKMWNKIQRIHERMFRIHVLAKRLLVEKD